MQNLTTIHLMRHGEVDNPDGVLYGRLPGYHLTDLGRQMAQMSAEYLFEKGAARARSGVCNSGLRAVRFADSH